MNKEQLYDVFIKFKEGNEAVSIRNKHTLDVNIVGEALILKLLHEHGTGMIIYSLSEIHECSVVPLSDEDCEKILKELGGN